MSHWQPWFGLPLYQNRNWPEARNQFRDLIDSAPDTVLYQLYLNRIEQLLQNPPAEDWSGVFIFQEK
tara:strand:+ start:2631 stop:2831 length:201 start_codon:yes stop_codon:yes gene_type:complete